MLLWFSDSFSSSWSPDTLWNASLSLTAAIRRSDIFGGSPKMPSTTMIAANDDTGSTSARSVSASTNAKCSGSGTICASMRGATPSASQVVLSSASWPYSSP